eukprot:GHVT01102564.1.p1 GENE.GHVT01102564.1~~GHVT01102564.1.p1  ORF type:complete len:132 (-),score=15.51 GHVT01102564.1:436-831(-)
MPPGAFTVITAAARYGRLSTFKRQSTPSALTWRCRTDFETRAPYATPDRIELTNRPSHTSQEEPLQKAPEIPVGSDLQIATTVSKIGRSKIDTTTQRRRRTDSLVLGRRGREAWVWGGRPVQVISENFQRL